MAAIVKPPVGSKVSSRTANRSGAVRVSSWSAPCRVRVKLSSMPKTPTSTVIAAATASTVSSVRRGVRSKLLIGYCCRLRLGQGSRAPSRAQPGRADAPWPVRIVCAGSARTARHTGIAVATNGMPKPMRPPTTNGRSSKGVSQTGSGSALSSSERMAAATSSPTPMPAIAPSRATWNPTSRGRTASW